MKRLPLVLILLAAWFLAFGCAPDEVPATEGCSQLADCPVGMLCNLDSKTCVPEASNSMLGRFSCTLKSPEADAKEVPLNQFAEVVVRVGSARAVFANIGCILDDSIDSVIIGISDVDAVLDVRLILTASKARSNPVVQLQPVYDSGEEAVGMTLANGNLVATTKSGKVDIKGDLKIGSVITGYFDATLMASADSLPRFGKPCDSDGLASCGGIGGKNGGVESCRQYLKSEARRICVRECKLDNECFLQPDSICLGGLCAQKCVRDEECAPPTQCLDATKGGVKGCR